MPKPHHAFAYTSLRHAYLAFALATLNTAAFATNYTVTNCLDAGSGSFRQAVLDANANPGDDTINFNLSCSTITLTSGTVVIAESLIVNAPGASSLTLANPTGNALRLEPAAAAPALQQVQINGLRIANSGTTDTLSGGAIDAVRTNLGISNSVFASNFAGTGSAIAFSGIGGSSTTTLNIDSTTFVGNARNGRAAGAIAATDALVTINRSFFKENGAGADGAGANSSFPGGAVLSQRGALLVADSVFQGNRGTYGGAVARTGTASDTARILRSSFFGNVAYGVSDAGNSGGGAIFSRLVPITIENSTFFSNTVQGQGYGAAIDVRSAQTIVRSATIASNVVESTLPTNAALTVIEDTSAPGTTVMNLANTVATDTRATTVDARLDAWVGGGVNFSGIVNTSLISRLRYQLGDATNSTAILLGPLAFNGGSVTGAAGADQAMLTLSPLPGSPLINAGSNDLTTDLFGVDQRGTGFPRIVDSVVDIGALEFAAPTVPSNLSVPTLPIGALFLLGLLAASCAVVCVQSSKKFPSQVGRSHEPQCSSFPNETT
jgi:hypothetical protein